MTIAVPGDLAVHHAAAAAHLCLLTNTTSVNSFTGKSCLQPCRLDLAHSNGTHPENITMCAVPSLAEYLHGKSCCSWLVATT